MQDGNKEKRSMNWVCNRPPETAGEYLCFCRTEGKYYSTFYYSTFVAGGEWRKGEWEIHEGWVWDMERSGRTELKVLAWADLELPEEIIVCPNCGYAEHFSILKDKVCPKCSLSMA